MKIQEPSFKLTNPSTDQDYNQQERHQQRARKKEKPKTERNKDINKTAYNTTHSTSTQTKSNEALLEEGVALCTWSPKQKTNALQKSSQPPKERYH